MTLKLPQPASHRISLTLSTGSLAVAILAQVLLRQEKILPAVLLFCLALVWGGLGLRVFIFPDSQQGSLSADGDFTRPVIRLGLAALGFTGLSLMIFNSENPTLSAWLFYLIGMGAIVIAAFNQGNKPGVLVKEDHPEKPWGWGESWLLALILGLALFMRIYLLQFYPFGTWFDEAFTGNLARTFLEEPTGSYPLYFLDSYDGPAHFLYLIVLAFKFFGISAYSMRLVTVFFGVGTVAAGYLVGRELIDRRFGFLVAFFLAVSSWDVNFSRMAMWGVTVPFFGLLVVGLLLRAIRRGRWSDYAWSGLALGLGMCFYSAFQAFPLVTLTFLGALALTRRDYLRRHWRGLVFFALGAVIAAAPILEYAAVHPDLFWERTQQVSIFSTTSPENLPGALWENTRQHLLMFNYAGDRNGRHNLPGEPMLDQVSAAFMALGLGLCLLRWRSPRSILLITWLVIMLLPGVFSLDFEAPQSLRSLGALAPAYLFCVIPLYAVVKLWEEHLPANLARLVWLPASLLLVQVFGANFNQYFNRQVTNTTSWSAFSTSETLAAGVMNTYGTQAYTYYLSSFYTNSPTIQFLAPQIQEYRIVETDDHIPLKMDTTRGAIFLLDPERIAIEEQLKEYYPQAEFKRYYSPDGNTPYLLTAIISREQVNQIQGLVARYTPENADTAQIRKVDQLREEWAEGNPLDLPFQAEWNGVLYAPRYGVYQLTLAAPGQGSLSIDNQILFEGNGTQAAEITLARGNHTLSVRAEGGAGLVDLRWITPDGVEETIPAWALFVPPVTNNGLLGEFYANGDWSPPAALAEVTPQLNLYFHNLVLDRPYSVEWSGLIRIDQPGSYLFELISIDESSLVIDDAPVLEAPSGQAGQGSVELGSGFHTLKIRFADRTSHSRISFYWQPPGEERGLVPQDVLYPPSTDPEQVSIPTDLTWIPEKSEGESLQPGNVARTDGQILWQVGSCGEDPDQFASPRSLALDAQGNLYVADAGNRRIVKLSPDGEVIGTIGGENSRLVEPVGSVVTQKGNLIVLDTEQKDWLLEFDNQGKFLRTISTETVPYHPRGLSIDDQDNLLVADTGNLRLLHLAPDGTLLSQWGGENTAIGQGQPVSVAAAPEGGFYWIEAANGLIAHLLPGDITETLARITSTNTVEGPQISLGPDGQVYVTDPENKSVYGMDASGGIVFQMSGGPFIRPTGIAAGPGGELYILDVALCQVFRISTE